MTGVLPEIGAFQDDLTGWRRQLHQHPELDLDCHTTADFIVARLEEFGIKNIHRGVAKSGVVSVIEGQTDGPTIGLRADMDALPILEETGAAWASKRAGVMHACGHDGHTVMLLGAARYLSAHRNFAGRVVLLFQPGEELSGGGRIMVEDGILDRFDVAEVYAMHTLPGAEAGSFHTRCGPLLASVDDFRFEIKGRSGHVAYPDQCINPLDGFAPLLGSIAQIQSETRANFGEGVIAATVASAGTVTNIVPGTAHLSGSVRSLSEAFRDEAEQRLRSLADTSLGGLEVQLDYDRYYPVLETHDAQTAFASAVAKKIVGDHRVDDATAPHLVAEDFAYMLNARPGSFLFLGQGNGPGLHNAGFDFNDAVAPIGASFFVRLVQARSAALSAGL